MYKRRLLQQKRAERKIEAQHLINLSVAYSTLNTYFPRSGYQHRLSDTVGRLGWLARERRPLFDGYKFRDYIEDLVQ